MTTTSASVTPAGACTTTVWLNCSTGPSTLVQPTHDRGGHHRPDTLIDRAARTVGHPGHPGQPGHRLLDENVARATQHPGHMRPRHHLHRQNAVPAQLEERVVDPDPLQPQHLGVDAGQDLLDRIGRGAVTDRRPDIPVPAGRVCRVCRSPSAAARRSPPPQPEPYTPAAAQPARRAPRPDRRRGHRLGDITHQTLVAGTVLAGDHHRLRHPIQPGQRGLHLTQLDAIPADLDLLISTPQIPSCPSAPQHTRSPVRYIRAPGPPNGHATNRDPVNPARPTYPYPTPEPATYNSPTTPAGTGRNHPSSTKKPRCANGTPIGLTALSTSPSTISRNDACTVVSVVPYMLIIRGSPGAHRSTTSRRWVQRFTSEHHVSSLS